MKNTKIWLTPLVIFSITFILCAVCFFGTRSYGGKLDKKEHVRPVEFTEADNACNLYAVSSYRLEDGRYVEFVQVKYPNRIAFISDEDDIEIEYAGNSYNPRSYFNDEYEIMDMSQAYFESMQHRLVDEDGNEVGEVITDISAIDPDAKYSFVTSTYKGVHYGHQIIEQYDNMHEVKVYDYHKAYLGFEKPFEADKEKIASLTIQLIGIIAAVFVGFVGTLTASILLIVNLVIYRKKRA